MYDVCLNVAGYPVVINSYSDFDKAKEYLEYILSPYGFVWLNETQMGIVRIKAWDKVAGVIVESKS